MMYSRLLLIILESVSSESSGSLGDILTHG